MFTVYLSTQHYFQQVEFAVQGHVSAYVCHVQIWFLVITSSITYLAQIFHLNRVDPSVYYAIYIILYTTVRLISIGLHFSLFTEVVNSESFMNEYLQL
jgi:hypothetical protein